MLNEIQKIIEELVSLYESEKKRAADLETKNSELKDENLALKKQIKDLDEKIGTIELAGAFGTATSSNVEAKEKIDKLIREVDKCIKLLKG